MVHLASRLILYHCDNSNSNDDDDKNVILLSFSSSHVQPLRTGEQWVGTPRNLRPSGLSLDRAASRSQTSFICLSVK